MNMLSVECIQCRTISQFYWCFNDDIILQCNICKTCSNRFTLELPKQNTKNIIMDPALLPPEEYCDAFYHEADGNFFYYQLLRNDITVPIILLKKTIDYRFRDGRQYTREEEGLVTIQDIEEFINQYTF